MKIENAVALVTGSNRGIGKAFVDGLLKQGARKIYAANRSHDSAKTIPSHDGRLIPLRLDVTNPDEVKAAARMASDVNLLINNAGIAAFEGFLSATNLNMAGTEMDVNYFGSLAMIREFAHILKANGGGQIVQISSILGMVTIPFVGSYSASKAAVNMLIQGARAELAAQNTKVMGVYPGVVDTDMSVGFNMPGAPPVEIVNAVLSAIGEEVEDLFPDPMSRDIHANLLENPKAVEQQFSDMLPT